MMTDKATSPATTSLIEDKLKYLLETRKEDLSKGDLEFASSLEKGFKRKGSLTPAQLPWLDKLVDKYDEDKMDQRVACRQAWVDEYRTDAEKRRVFEVCVEYYENNKPYFGQVIAAYRADEKGYVPTKKTYYKMCENKYAKKVIGELNKTPIFAEGEMVAIRGRKVGSDFTGANPKWLKASTALIIESLGTAVTAAKGSKQYLCLPVGGTKTFITEERYLKKIRKGKRK